MRKLFLLFLLGVTALTAEKPFYPNFSDNMLYTYDERKLTVNYLLPLKSPIKPILDKLFATRVTLNMQTLNAAGFRVIASRPRSYVKVVSHPSLKGYILKLHLDNLLKRKSGVPGWKWFVYRAKGAKNIAKVIEREHLNLVAVPKKWIYPLPPKFPAVATQHEQKHSVLVAERMPLVPKWRNKLLWQTALTKEHLRQLYIVLRNASSIRPRPDNVWFMPDGRLALIDTEYADKKPDYTSIRPYLKPELLDYWDALVGE